MNRDQIKMTPRIVNTISCAELHQASLTAPIKLIDVRTPEEFHEIRATTARNMPLDTLDPAAVIKSCSSSSGEPIYFICAVGARSAWACELMMAAGYNNVVNVEGGTHAWHAAGLPTKSGP